MGDSEPHSALADLMTGAMELLGTVASSPLYRVLVRLEAEERQQMQTDTPEIHPVFEYETGELSDKFAIKLADVYRKLKKIRDEACTQGEEAKAISSKINAIMSYISKGV